ncbi:MAG: hypothetical protein AMXMBFR84_40880 [Candidatus Hydrogenedentota bacterium]
MSIGFLQPQMGHPGTETVVKKQPVFSVIIPAYDEEKFLPKCLGAIQKAIDRLGEEVEVIVVDNNSRDRTPEVAREFGANVIHIAKKNLSHIRNQGAKHALGKNLVFIDADSVMSDNMLIEIRKALETGKYVGGGIANCMTDRVSFGIIASMALMAPLWLRDRTAMVVFYTTRENFESIGGFNEDLHTMEDCDFGRRLKRKGKEIGKKYKNMFSAKVITSARKFDEYGDWYLLTRPLTVLKFAKNDPVAAYEFWYRPRR